VRLINLIEIGRRGEIRGAVLPGIRDERTVIFFDPDPVLIC